MTDQRVTDHAAPETLEQDAVEQGVATGGLHVWGRGQLYGAIAAAAREHGVRAHQGHRRTSLLVVAADGWDTTGYPAARAAATRASVAWLPVRTELSHAVVGPMETPDRAGCVECARTRRERIRGDRTASTAIWQRHRDELEERASSWLTRLAAELVAALVRDEGERLDGGRPPRTRLGLLRVDLASLAVTRHAYLPDPGCAVCGTTERASASSAQVDLAPVPVHRPGSYRVRPVEQELPSLCETYVDEQVGLVQRFHQWDAGGMVITAAPVGFRNGGGDSGYGRTAGLRAGRLTALLEGLERYGSAPYRSSSVTASYQEVQAHAVDPHTLGLYPRERYDLPGFHFQPFEPDRPYRWVWGWSFARGEPVLVPEFYAYYGASHHGTHGHGFVYEISNGCALGGCLVEAILYGLLEVAERDAFLLTWYARLPAPRIDLATFRDRTVPLLAATIGAETGYEVRAFDISVEQRIPCVWAMAVNLAQDGRPAVACAAGSHLDPERAAGNALAELGPALGGLIHRYRNRDEVSRSRRLRDDPTLVRTMDDHALRYADPVAASRLRFLTGSGSPEAAVAGEATRTIPDDDLRDVLVELVRRYTDCGMDVIAVDQTAPEHRAGGLSCAKVVIPGTLPMTFGHRHRRVDGLPRLYQVPQLLGYLARPLRPDEVNPDPHPFP